MQTKKPTDQQLPIYRRIEQFVLENIHDSRYQQGMLIPSEEEFCTMFSTSRMTVRKAMDTLVARGVLHRIKGKGTFVSKFNIEKTMNSVTGWNETMKAGGHKSRSKVLSFQIEKCDEIVAKNLNMNIGSDVYVLARLRYADDIPVLIERAHLNAALFPDFLNHSFPNESMYDVIEGEYNIKLNHVYQKLHTEEITGEYASLIFDKPSAVAMVMENTSFDQYTRPIEYTVSYINGACYSLRYVVNK